MKVLQVRATGRRREVRHGDGARPAGRNAVMVPAWPGQLSVAELRRQAAMGERPRTDYVELATALGADVMDMEYLEQRATRPARVLARWVGTPTAQVVEAFLRRGAWDGVVARADRLGLPLALLHKLARSSGHVVLVSVWLSRPRKAVFLHPLRVHTHLKAIVNYGSRQMGIAANRLHVPSSKLHLALQPVDELFWTPAPRPPAGEPVICSVGAEARDYPTLLAAVHGLAVRTELAVGTTVFVTGDLTAELATVVRPVTDAGPGVVVHQQLAHTELRSLYTRSRFVVVPLEDVEFDAGVTVIAEAMAMGKAVIVTRTRGQTDLVVVEGETGLYVPPRDPAAPRAAIRTLLDDPDGAEEMGRRGRALVEERLTLDRWVRTVACVTVGRSPSATDKSYS